MSTSNETDFLTRLNEKLPLLSTRIKDIIYELYQTQTEIFNDENYQQQREEVQRLFHDLLESLQNDLFDLNNRIVDTQINILWTNTKKELENFKDQFLATTSNTSAFNSIFIRLIEYIETTYNIMQSVFKQLTVIVIRLFDLVFHSARLFRLKQIKSSKKITNCRMKFLI
jgi:uncharacterized protein YpuA (DUF1002 family)